MTTAALIDTVIYRNAKPLQLNKEVLLILSGTALLAALAQVVIPLAPVPITGQSLGVLVIGASYGARRALLTLLTYTTIGLLGLPVFAEAGSGIQVITGATGGYIVGMVVAAWFMGFLSERGQDRNIFKALLTFSVGHLIIFSFGICWLGQLMSWEQAIAVGLVPFIPGMVIKTVLAAGALPTAWRLVKK